MTISKWVNLIFATIALLAFIVFDKALALLFENVEMLNNTPLLGRYVTITTFIALVASAIFTFWFYRKPNSFAYLSEVVVELRKVTWPSMDETKRSTVIVIIFTILLSAYLAVFDQIWKYLTDLIITGGA